MMTMMASLVEWRSNGCPFSHLPSFFTFFFFFISLITPSPSLFYPPLTFCFFPLFSYLPLRHTAATQSAGTGNSFLHDDVRTSAFSFCFLLLNGCVLGTLHHITSPFGFSFYVDVGIYLRGTYIIYRIPIWTWGGIGLELIFQQLVQVHHITPYYILLCLSFLPLLSLCLCHFVRCVRMRRGCFNVDFTTTYVSSVIIFPFVSSFSYLSCRTSASVFIISCLFDIHIYIQLCVGEGDFVYGMCSHLALVMFVYFDWMGPQWRYCISLSRGCSVYVMGSEL